MTGEEFFNLILKIGSFSGLVSIVLAIRDRSRKRPKFKYTFRGSSGKARQEKEHQFYDIEFNGDVKNQSPTPNTITNIYYVIWDGKSNTRTLTFGGEPKIIDQADDNEIKLPMSFNPHESKRLLIKYSVILTGTHVEKLVSEVKRVSEQSNLYLPKHEFKLAFQDTNENIFNQNGLLLSRKLIDLWWTLPNSFESLKKGNPFPWIKHMLKIAFDTIGHNITKWIYKLGI